MKLRHLPRAFVPTLRYLPLHFDSRRHEVYVHGLKRSGNHAVINWMIRQARGPAAFLNNVEPGRSFLRPADKVIVPGNGNGAAPLVIASYEDKELAEISGHPRERRRRATGAHVVELLVLRDPFNTFASRHRRKHRPFCHDRAYREWVKAQWKDYAREFLGETDHLSFGRVGVDYNRWFRDVDYRRALAERLDLPFSDAGIRDVPDYGGGSSFEGTGSDGRADRMAVMDRWKELLDDQAFVDLFRGDHELFELSRRIFGDLEGTEALVRG